MWLDEPPVCAGHQTGLRLPDPCLRSLGRSFSDEHHSAWPVQRVGRGQLSLLPGVCLTQEESIGTSFTATRRAVDRGPFVRRCGTARETWLVVTLWAFEAMDTLDPLARSVQPYRFNKVAQFPDNSHGAAQIGLLCRSRG